MQLHNNFKLGERSRGTLVQKNKFKKTATFNIYLLCMDNLITFFELFRNKLFIMDCI